MSEASLGYRVEGNGPPLLLVHGFGISYPIWSSLLPLLREHFTVIMVELPGVGVSPPPSPGEDYVTTAVDGLERLRHRMGLNRWIILGYSTGSRIVEAYVHLHAACVSRAIFLCPLRLDANKARSLRFGLRLDDRWPALGDWILSGWRLKFLISWLGFNLHPDPRSAEWYAEITATSARTLKQTLRAIAASAKHPLSVPVPYAMIWADHDLVPDRPTQLGQCDYIVRGRHAAPVESAGEVARVVFSLAQEDPTELTRPA